MTMSPLSNSAYVLASFSWLNFWNTVEDWTGWQPAPESQTSVIVAVLILVSLVPIIAILWRRLKEATTKERRSYASRSVKSERLRREN